MDHPSSFLSNRFGLFSGKEGGKFLLFLCVAIINAKIFTVFEFSLEDPLLSSGIVSSVMRNSMYCAKHYTMSTKDSLGFVHTFIILFMD